MAVPGATGASGADWLAAVAAPAGSGSAAAETACVAGRLETETEPTALLPADRATVAGKLRYYVAPATTTCGKDNGLTTISRVWTNQL